MLVALLSFRSFGRLFSLWFCSSRRSIYTPTRLREHRWSNLAHKCQVATIPFARENNSYLLENRDPLVIQCWFIRLYSHLEPHCASYRRIPNAM